GPRHRIRHIRLVEVDAGDALTVLVCYSAGYADDNGVRRDFPHDDRPGADPAAGADLERADDLRAGADDHVVAERGMALLALEAGAAERDTLEERDVLADLGRLSDHHAHAVID